MTALQKTLAIVILVLANMATGVTSVAAQSVSGGKSAREGFAALGGLTAYAPPSLDRLERLAIEYGLRPGERASDATGSARTWSLTASDGVLELLAVVGTTETSYQVSFSPRRPYARMPDPVLSWMLQTAQDVALQTVVSDEFEIRLSETPLEGRGNSLGIRGRQVKIVRVSTAGEFLGTSTTNAWPRRSQ